MRIDTSGRVGIGAVPSAWTLAANLDVGAASVVGNSTNAYFSANQYYDGAWKYKADGFGTTLLQTNGNFDFYTAPTGLANATATQTLRMRLTPGGDLGIGTSSPSSRLDVRTSAAEIARFSSSATNGGYQIFYPDNVTTPVYVGSLKAILSTGNATDFAIVGTGANNMVFGTNSAERARINSSGNLLVGATTSPEAARLYSESNTATTAVPLVLHNTATGSTSYNVAVFYRNTASTGSISTTNNATAYNTSSDYRLKENIQPMTGALAKVAALKPCTYTWKDGGMAGEGFIAHELQAVCPDAVTGEKDAVNADGKPVYQGIDTSFLVATLTAAIQELKAELDATKAEVAALKGA